MMKGLEEVSDHLCRPDECDTFQFMAKDMGLKVLHPGGLHSTLDLARMFGLRESMTILDVGCGSGSSAIRLVKEFGCRVLGIDVDRELLHLAAANTNKTNENRVTFRYADAHELPFENDVFDGAICQAVLVFTDKRRVLHELTRVVKPGGFIGAVELAWKQEPPSSIINMVQRVLCSASINAAGHEEWSNLFHGAGLVEVSSELRDLTFDIRDLLKNEGILNGFKAMYKTFFQPVSKERMRSMRDLFKENQKYLGYGLYTGRVT